MLCEQNLRRKASRACNEAWVMGGLRLTKGIARPLHNECSSLWGGGGGGGGGGGCLTPEACQPMECCASYGCIQCSMHAGTVAPVVALCSGYDLIYDFPCCVLLWRYKQELFGLDMMFQMTLMYLPVSPSQSDMHLSAASQPGLVFCKL